MNRGAYLDQYRRNSVDSASPLQLVIMLYDGALRFIEQARVAIKQKNLAAQNDSLQKAQRIIAELTSSLDMDRGGEIATNLFSLYNFCYSELVTANIMDDESKLDAVIVVLVGLRDGWVQLDAQQKSNSVAANFGNPSETRLAS